MTNNKKILSLFIPSIVVVLLLLGCINLTADTLSPSKQPLRMAIAPYQDLALILNEKQIQLEKKYKIKLDFITVSGEDLLSCLASAGQTVDVSYALLTEYLMKSANINRGSSDPIIFLYPICVFRGGGFVSFNSQIPQLNSQNIHDTALVKKFLSFKIGTPKCTWSEMMLFVLAKNNRLKLSDLHYTDIPLADGLLAIENGSLDMSAAGLPQRNECLKRGGRVVLGLDTLGMGDIIGLACRQSTYKKRKREIESLIKMWIECANYTLADIDHHANKELAYLKTNSSTHYTAEEFERALSLEYFPKNIAEIKKEIIADDGQYSIKKATNVINQYLISIGMLKTSVSTPQLIELSE